MCLGKNTCTFVFLPGTSPFGPDPCPLVVKTLAIGAICGGGTSFHHTATAVVTEGGTMVWNGSALVGSHPGISQASDAGEGVAFEVANGAYAFASTPGPQ